MSDAERLLAVIPARGGSKGLPGKNIRPLSGVPLIAHTVMFAQLCPEIDRCIVSTDSPEIADVAKTYGADVPFLRPPELAQDETPICPVLRHALDHAEKEDGVTYDFLMLLDGTAPTREPRDIAKAFAKLREQPDADGIIGVSQPEYNPIWYCVVELDGLMVDLMAEGSNYERRQDVPPVYRINGMLYIWRTDYLRKTGDSWRVNGQHLIYDIPEERAISIDTIEQFERAEALIKSGRISLPWLDNIGVNSATP